MQILILLYFQIFPDCKLPYYFYMQSHVLSFLNIFCLLYSDFLQKIILSSCYSASHFPHIIVKNISYAKYDYLIDCLIISIATRILLQTDHLITIQFFYFFGLKKFDSFILLQCIQLKDSSYNCIVEIISSYQSYTMQYF